MFYLTDENKNVVLEFEDNEIKYVAEAIQYGSNDIQRYSAAVLDFEHKAREYNDVMDKYEKGETLDYWDLRTCRQFGYAESRTEASHDSLYDVGDDISPLVWNGAIGLARLIQLSADKKYSDES